MESTIRSILSDVHVQFMGADGQPIDGFFPGPTYSYAHLGQTPFYLYIRDTATDLPMARYYYGATALRSTVEEFLRLQYPDGAISATISPGPQGRQGHGRLRRGDQHHRRRGRGLQRHARPGLAQPDPARPDAHRTAEPGHELGARPYAAIPIRSSIKRAHTTDWGDIKWEPNSDPSDMDPGDQWTVSIYDQAIGYAALQGLARLNAAAGRDGDRARWEAEASDLKAATNLVLWQDDADHGFYRIHRHLAPDNVAHDFPEDNVISIGNAAAIYYGLADPDKVPRILGALERARIAAGASKPGLTLQPAYDNWFQVSMGQRTYQNGALWDWWAGRQISAEFWSGYSQMARDHLLMVARDWATHPGKVREWESPSLNRSGADQAYAGAAAVVGQSVVDGLFGVRIVGQK